MPRVKVVYNRNGCIGAAVCVAVAPKFWKMAEDNKADLLGSYFDENTNRFILEIDVDEQDLQLLKESAQGCPAFVIEVIEER